MNILIADDNEDVRTLHETILESLGHTVESAEDGLQALKLAKYSRPDIIISDIMMPEMDGFELCRTIKNDEQLKTIPFIFYTATFTEPGDERLAMALGASEFIIKPTEPDDFINIINGVIEDHRLKKLHVPDRASNAGKTLGHMHNERLTRKLDKKVSDLEEKNRALQASEQKYRRLVEGLQSDYIFYAFDTDGAFTYISPSVNDVLGYTQDDFFNNYREYFSDNPINRDVAGHTKRSLKGEKSPAYEMEMYHKDGSIRSFEVTEVPIFDKKQKVIAVEGIARDITIQKKAEAQRKRSVEELHTVLIQTVQAMGLTMEKRDPYTAGHQQRVAELAVAIAQELGLPDEKVEGIILGAMIHDIGKLCVPAEILNRPGKLTDAEFAIIKSHPQVGYDIIKDVDFPWPVSDMILQHHEHLDGSGYPNGLKGDDIILEARILAVADVMEAMASHRPYRPSLGIDVALNAIKENRGTHYDQDVVDASLRLIEEKRFRFDLRS